MFLLQLKMSDPLLLLLMASMAIVTLPLAQGQCSVLLFLGPARSSGQSEVISIPTTNNSSLTSASCTVPRYPVAHNHYTVGFIYEDLLYICGGRHSTGSHSRQSSCFSLINSTWSPTTPLLSARSEAAAVRMRNGTVLVSGGWSNSSRLQSSELLTGSTWTPAMQLPSPRNGHCMLLLSSGELFLNGGYTNSGKVSDTYISEDKLSWGKVTSSKTARYNHACTEVAISHQVWIGGGHDNSSEIFQLVDGTWTSTDGPDLPNYSYYSGQLVVYNGKMFYAGGNDNKNIYQLKDGWTQQDAWTKIGEMSETRYGFTPLVITADICKGEKPTPIYDPELTQSEYNTCLNGSCAYVGGDLASTFADLVSNSSEIIEVECCTSGGIIDDTIQTCGNGTSCSTICGPHTGCLTIKASLEAENSTICSSSMDAEDWCQKTGVIDDLLGKTCQNGEERKKRYARIHALPIYRLWYCPQRVKTVGSLARYPECCFHPAVRQRNQAIKQKCCWKYKVCV